MRTQPSTGSADARVGGGALLQRDVEGRGAAALRGETEDRRDEPPPGKCGNPLQIRSPEARSTRDGGRSGVVGDLAHGTRARRVGSAVVCVGSLRGIDEEKGEDDHHSGRRAHARTRYRQVEQVPHRSASNRCAIARSSASRTSHRPTRRPLDGRGPVERYRSAPVRRGQYAGHDARSCPDLTRTHYIGSGPGRRLGRFTRKTGRP